MGARVESSSTHYPCRLGTTGYCPQAPNPRGPLLECSRGLYAWRWSIIQTPWVVGKTRHVKTSLSEARFLLWWQMANRGGGTLWKWRDSSKIPLCLGTGWFTWKEKMHFWKMHFRLVNCREPRLFLRHVRNGGSQKMETRSTE